MANPHFGRIGDLWKHLPLVQVLAIERPSRYWETHAGSAMYPLSRSWERDYGVYRFLEHAEAVPCLSASRYLLALRRLPEAGGVPTMYPGSGLLAMLELGTSCDEYVFCDLDAASVHDLVAGAQRLGLAARVRTVIDDGVAAIWREASLATPSDLSRIMVHVDPFDPWHDSGPAGFSPLELVVRLAERGTKVIFWYGHEQTGRFEPGWAWRQLGSRLQRAAASVWCGEIMLNALTHRPVEANPGVRGCGVLLANCSAASYAAATHLGEGLASIYRDAMLPTGESGALRYHTVAEGL